MKKLLIILSIITSLLFSAEVFARSKGGGHVHVSGYTRKDGTYVQPHYRTAPDGIKTNNWSYSGNVNPYTGKVGTNPDSSPNYGRTGGYYNPGYTTPLPSHYISNGAELHNSRNPTSYMD